MGVKVLKAPEILQEEFDGTSIFLAGSIEMGKAEDWQTVVTKHIEKVCPKDGDIVVYNPRRDDWDSSWEQKIDNPQFFEQVTWELDHIDNSDIVVVCFDKTTKAPITLLELGKVAAGAEDKTILVCCPEGFWRKGNVDIVCSRAGIPVLESIEELCEELTKKITTPEEENNEYKKEFPFVEESADTSDTVSFGYILSLNNSPKIEIEEGSENLLYVKEFDFIANACHMGKVTLLERQLITGICTEDNKSTIKLNIKVNDKTMTESFTLVKASENQKEKIVLNTKD